MGNKKGEESSKEKSRASLLSRLTQLEYTNIKPTEVTDLTKMKKDSEWQEIKELYSHKDYKLIACLINGLVTSETPVFMLSKRIFEELVAKDENIKRKTINSTDYKRVISNSVEIGLITCLCKPSGFKDQKKVAGLYAIKDQAFLKLIEKYKEKGAKVFEAYFKFQKRKPTQDTVKIFEKLVKEHY